MIKTQVNFFYFAGSIVGGIIFLGTTLGAGALSTYLLYPDKGFLSESVEMISSIWATFFLLCLSLIIGIVISQTSLLYYRIVLRSDKFQSFVNEFSKQEGLPILPPRKEGRHNPLYELQTFTAFANNQGHPNDMYDIAGRARLAGSTALNAIWAVILSLILIIPLVKSIAPPEIKSIISWGILFVALFSLFLAWAAHKLTKITWWGYLTRREVFSIYFYHEGRMERSSFLPDILANHAQIDQEQSSQN